jgi:hypothetical protein
MLLKAGSTEEDAIMNSAKQPFAVEAGASRPVKTIQLNDRQILVRVSGEDNGGGFALFEVPAAPNAGRRCTRTTTRMNASMSWRAN